MPLVFWLLLQALRSHRELVTGEILEVLPWLPFAFLGAVVMLSWYFRRSRFFWFSVVLTASLVGLSELGFFSTQSWWLVPVSLFALIWLEDRPLGSVANLIAGAWLLAVLALGQWLTQGRQAIWMEQHGQLAGLGVLLLCAAALVWRQRKFRGPLDRGLVAVFALSVLAGLARLSWWEQNLLWLTQAAVMIGSVIANSHRLAYMDELTELPGRRALKEEMRELHQTYAVAMLDVDHFKQFNDTHGHDVGDQVLRMVASRMKRVGGGGRPFRYGGEEFTVLFPGRSAGQVVEVLDELRENIARNAMVLRAPDRPKKKPKAPPPSKGPRKTVSVTISIGVASPRAGQNPDQVLKVADQALYKAKKKGRNQVCQG